MHAIDKFESTGLGTEHCSKWRENEPKCWNTKSRNKFKRVRIILEEFWEVGAGQKCAILEKRSRGVAPQHHARPVASRHHTKEELWIILLVAPRHHRTKLPSRDATGYIIAGGWLLLLIRVLININMIRRTLRKELRIVTEGGSFGRILGQFLEVLKRHSSQESSGLKEEA